MTHRRVFKNTHKPLVNSLGRTHDDRLRALQIIPVLCVAKQWRCRVGMCEIIAELRWRNVGNAGAKRELASFAALMPFQAIAEEVPDAFPRFLLRNGVRFRDIG